MVRRTPARPNTASEATTDDASRGGLFTDETDRNVVIDTSSFRGEDGIPGPQGVGVQSITAMQSGAGNPVTVTYTLSNGTIQEIEYSVVNGQMGDPGMDGMTGATGPEGRHVVSGVVNTDGTITFTNSDGSTFNTTGNVRGPQGEQGLMGNPGDDGMPGADGVTFVPIYYREGAVNQAIDLVSFTEQDEHTHVTNYRSDNPLSILIFARGYPDQFSNEYNPDNPQLDPSAAQTLQTNLSTGRLGNHILGAAGPQGDQGPPGTGYNIDDVRLATVATDPVNGNTYRFDIDIVDPTTTPPNMLVETVSTDTFRPPRGPDGPQGTPGTDGTDGTPVLTESVLEV